MSTKSWRGSKARIGAEPLLQSSQKNIVLTGFMAAGKSVVGQKLGLRLKRPFVDLDHSIEAREGAKVEEIFNRKGEAYFRKVERETLKEILSEDGQVIATGGGAVMEAENLRLLKKRSILICLTASPEALLRRSGADSQRPLLRGNDRRKRIEELLKRRKKVYGQAHISIDTEQLSVDEVVEKIMQAIRFDPRGGH